MESSTIKVLHSPGLRTGTSSTEWRYWPDDCTVFFVLPMLSSFQQALIDKCQTTSLKSVLPVRLWTKHSILGHEDWNETSLPQQHSRPDQYKASRYILGTGSTFRQDITETWRITSWKTFVAISKLAKTLYSGFWELKAVAPKDVLFLKVFSNTRPKNSMNSSFS